MNNKKYGLLGGGIIVLAIISAIGIVYAALSQTLNINGTANVKAQAWDVHFIDLKLSTMNGSAQELTAPNIKNNSTTIGDYSVLLSKPGDSIEYTFKITNEGDFHAILNNIVLNKPTCTGTGDNAIQDAENVCKNLVYELNYDTTLGDQITMSPNQTFNLETVYKPYWDMDIHQVIYYCNENYILKPNRANDVWCTLRLEYNSNTLAEELPTNDVAISNLGIQIDYIQTESECTVPEEVKPLITSVMTSDVDWGGMEF